MSTLLLVRHGQASWGADDYDVLSETGEEQARVLGHTLAARGVVPDLLVHGVMKRQRETARLIAEAARWQAVPAEDFGWDEMDHVEVLSRQPATFTGDNPTPREFQTWFEAATDRWAAGTFDSEYAESFPAFSARVATALQQLTDRLGEGQTAVVVTSGGPIARTCTELLGAGIATHKLLAAVVVNASVTKFVVGRRGTTVVSFNEHGYFEQAGRPDLITYR
ncbi:MAG TPA: histidine phosphatase family protein [Nocardioidaceae bacterium]|nr:histidine phosphatase family protein [Nocardioidaceae bacterium]